MQPRPPTERRDAKFIVQEATPDWTAATVGNVMITLMMKRGSEQQMRRLREIHDGWYAAHPQGIATFNIVLPSTLIPEQGSRDAAAEALAAMQGHHLASTTVILGDGFWAATIRSVLTTMFALSRTRVPQKVCATIDEGASHQAKLLGPKAPPADDIVMACASLLRTYSCDTNGVPNGG